MRERLMTALSQFFGLDEDEDFSRLADKSQVKNNSKLLTLIASLQDDELPFKIIAENLENLIVNILLKKETASTSESHLVELLKKIQQEKKVDDNTIYSSSGMRR